MVNGTLWYIYFKNGSVDVGPINFTEECMHYLEFFSIDYIGNTEDITNQTHYVDDTPPTTTKEYGSPNGTCLSATWITGNTSIYLNATDSDGNCAVGNYTIHYRVWYNGSWTSWMNGTVNTDVEFNMDDLSLGGSGLHYIEYYAVDALGNTETLHNRTFHVDNEGPEPTLVIPADGSHYMQSSMINMNHSEATGDVIVETIYEYWNGSAWVAIADTQPGVPGVQWDTSNLPVRDTSVRVRVRDDACRWGTSAANNITIDSDPIGRQTITLGSGWNLISTAVGLDSLGGDYTASVLASEINHQVGADIIQYVVKYNATTGEFNEYVVYSDIGWDFTIEQGEAYYLFSSSVFGGEEFTIVGDIPRDKTVDLDIGWNLIGWWSLETQPDVDFAAAIDAVAGAPTTDAIVWYDNSIGTYVTWTCGDVTRFTMQEDYGYWVHVTCGNAQDVPYPSTPCYVP